jgi:hypothetical protein
MAWSEPLFIVLCLAFLLVLSQVWDRRHLSGGDVAVLVGLGSAAFLIRYVGLTLVLVGGLVMLARLRPLDRRALTRVATFGLASAVVPIAWMLRNRAADGSLLGKYLGERAASQDSPRGVAVDTLSTLGEMALPVGDLANRPLVLLGSATVLLGLGGLVLALRAHRPRGALLCCAIFTLVYATYLISAALWTSFEPINVRYVAPIFVPGVVVAAAGVEALHERLSRPASRAAIGALTLGVIAIQLVASIGDARDGAADGIGFNRPAVTTAAIAEQAEQLLGDGDAVVYSNLPHGLWAATRIQPIRWAPREVGFRGVPLEGELDVLVRELECSSHPSYLVYYFNGSADVVSLEEIRAAVDTERVGVVPGGGSILRMSTDERRSCSEGSDPSPARIR